MKKLKKTLAALLVLVMALTIVPFAGANNGIVTHASFNDATDVSPGQRMALDVLAAVNILRGEEGSIFPHRNVNRGEAAVIVARTVLGPAATDQLPLGPTGFRDVDGQGWDWAAPAIAYLHEQGIVIGVGDNLFNPNGDVTSAEMAAMFLRAVGFGVNGEYTGPRWQTNAVVDGMHWRVLAGVGDIDFTAPATREQVMRYAFNAMNTAEDPVALCFVNWSTDRNAYVPVQLLDGTHATIHGRIFRPAPVNLLRSGDDDSFGRPVTRFTLRGVLIGNYDSPNFVEFTSHTSGAAVLSAIDHLIVPATVSSFVNGTNNSSIISSAVPIPRATVGASISSLTGNGTHVQVYFNPNTNVITRVTTIRTDISEVTRINAAAREVTVAVRTPQGADGINTAAFGSATSLVIGALHSLYNDVSGLELGAPVLVSPAFVNEAWTVGAVAFPEEVTGVLTSSATMVNFGGATGSLTVDGTVYSRAQVLTQGARTAAMTAAGIEVSLLLDTHGFIVDTTTTGISSRRILFVREVGTGLQGVNIRPVVSGWHPDGTAADIVLTAYRVTADGLGSLILEDADGNPATMPETGDIIHILGSGNNVRFDPAFDSASNLAEIGTIPATQGSITASVVSLNVNLTSPITVNQATLMVGNRNLRFADEAQFFWWDATAAGGAGRFTVTGRSRVELPITAGTNRGNDVVVAVVEYRVPGQAPVISALWIGRGTDPTISAETLVFIQPGGFLHTVSIDGTTYRMVRAFGINGQALVWNEPADWPPAAIGGNSWIAISGNPDGNVTAGFYTFTIDSNNRFVISDADLRPGDVFANYGVFTDIVATTNGLTQTTLPLAADATTTDLLATAVMGTMTQIVDIRGVGPAVNDRGAFYALVNNSDEVRVSVVFDVNNQSIASAIFIHSAS